MMVLEYSCKGSVQDELDWEEAVQRYGWLRDSQLYMESSLG